MSWTLFWNEKGLCQLCWQVLLFQCLILNKSWNGKENILKLGEKHTVTIIGSFLLIGCDNTDREKQLKQMFKNAQASKKAWHMTKRRQGETNGCQKHISSQATNYYSYSLWTGLNAVIQKRNTNTQGVLKGFGASTPASAKLCELQSTQCTCHHWILFLAKVTEPVVWQSAIVQFIYKGGCQWQDWGKNYIKVQYYVQVYCTLNSLLQITSENREEKVTEIQGYCCSHI